MNNINSGATNPARLFPLGQVVATPGALDALDRAAVNAMDLLRRHQHGDWGNVPPGDAEENDRSVANGWRILSSYTLCTDQKLWVITEADRSAITIITSSFRVLWEQINENTQLLPASKSSAGGLFCRSCARCSTNAMITMTTVPINCATTYGRRKL